MRFRKLFFGVLMIVGLITLISCDHHFYQPLKGEFYSPQEFQLIHKEVFFNTPDGEKLHGWFIPSQNSEVKGTILHLHGNSANMTNYLYYVAFLAKAGYHLMMFDYRGFGKSTGQPSPAGLLIDCEAALNYLHSREDVPKNEIVIYGQSLGGALAITLAGSSKQNRIKAVIAEAPFSSYREVAEEKMNNMVFLKWFSGIAADISIDDRIAPIAFVDKIAPIPLLIVHGTDDRVVPFHHGEKLYEQAAEPKLFWVIHDGRHIQMLSKFRSIYRPKLLEYLSKLSEP